MSNPSTTAHSTEAQAASNGRTVGGRFALGNPGGPGNPFARQVAGLRQALLDSVTAADMQDVVKKLVALAKDGNVQAAKLLFSYTVGKPQPAPEPDRMDVDEWEGYQETAGMKKEVAELTEAGTPEIHLHNVRLLRPLLGSLAQQQMVSAALEASEPDPREKARQERNAAQDERVRRYFEAVNQLDAERASAPSPDGDKRQAFEMLTGKDLAEMSLIDLVKGSSPTPNGINGHQSPSPSGKKRRSAAKLNGTPKPEPTDGRFQMD